MGADLTDSADLAGLLTGWPLLKVVLCYAFCPYVVLWVAVHCFPKGDVRRDEYLGEYEHVPMWARPMFVGGLVARCVTDGLSLRLRRYRSSHIERRAASVPVKPAPSRVWVQGYRPVLVPPLAFFVGLPWVLVLAVLPIDWSFVPDNAWTVGIGLVATYWVGLAQVHGVCELWFRRKLRLKRRAQRGLQVAAGPAPRGSSRV